MVFSDNDKDTIRDIVTDCLRVSNATLKTELKTELTTLIDSKVALVKTELSTLMDQKIEAAKHELKLDYDRQISDLKDEVKLVRGHLADDCFQLLDFEIHGRKRNCIVSNLKESATPRNESFEELTQKFKTSLVETVKLDPTLVESMTFNAAHRLGKLDETKVESKPRSAIIVFDKLHHIQALWAATKKLGKAEHSYKTHLPKALADYRTYLLAKRSDLQKQQVKSRVWEDHGYPTMEIYNPGSRRWEFTESFKSIHHRK